MQALFQRFLPVYVHVMVDVSLQLRPARAESFMPEKRLGSWRWSPELGQASLGVSSPCESHSTTWRSKNQWELDTWQGIFLKIFIATFPPEADGGLNWQPHTPFLFSLHAFHCPASEPLLLCSSFFWFGAFAHWGFSWLFLPFSLAALQRHRRVCGVGFVDVWICFWGLIDWGALEIMLSFPSGRMKVERKRTGVNEE